MFCSPLKPKKYCKTDQFSLWIKELRVDFGFCWLMISRRATVQGLCLCGTWWITKSRLVRKCYCPAPALISRFRARRLRPRPSQHSHYSRFIPFVPEWNKRPWAQHYDNPSIMSCISLSSLNYTIRSQQKAMQQIQQNKKLTNTFTILHIIYFSLLNTRIT